MAAAIKVNGKVLREFKDTVYIPFGSQYSILVKNLNTVRAVVHIELDGEEVVAGGLVVGAGQEVDLERWVKADNLKKGNKFKFIERTANIEQHRGVGLEDGIVRITYQFEQVMNPVIGIHRGNMPGVITTTNPWDTHGILRSSTSGGQSASYSSSMISTAAFNNVAVSATSATGLPGVTASMKHEQSNDAGITVPGSKSDQKFQTASWFPTESETHSMVFKLLGATEDNQPVYKAVTVKAKPKCVTCGKQNKATAKFCAECGTALEIFA